MSCDEPGPENTFTHTLTRTARLENGSSTSHSILAALVSGVLTLPLEPDIFRLMESESGFIFTSSCRVLRRTLSRDAARFVCDFESKKSCRFKQEH